MIKKLLVLFAAVGLGTPVLWAEDCQMLLPPEKQQEHLYGRNYPPSSKLRISKRAAADGFAALERKDLNKAMTEFNRAWRFRQDNPVAYWGAAIVYSLRSGEPGKKPEEALLDIRKALRLFDLAEKYLDQSGAEMRKNLLMDRAAGIYAEAKILKRLNDSAAETRFADAEKIWLSILKSSAASTQRGKLVRQRCCWHLYTLYRDWGKAELAERYLKQVDPELRKIFEKPY